MSTRSTAAVPLPARSTSSRATSSRSMPIRSTPTRVTAPRPQLRLVPAGAAVRARQRAAAVAGERRAPFVLLIVALLVGTTLALLVLNTAIAVDSLKATSLRAENAQRAQEVQRLEQLVVAGGAPAEVARVAVEQGLVPAGAPGYLVIGPDGEVELRGTPAPATAPPAADASPAAGPASGD